MELPVSPDPQGRRALTGPRAHRRTTSPCTRASKAPKPTGYSDEDLSQINQRLDEAEKKRDEAIQKAKDAYKRTVKVIEAEAKQVGVLMRPLKAARKVQRLEREIEAATARVKDDEIEVFTDMLGQMSFLPPANLIAGKPARGRFCYCSRTAGGKHR